jgi:hypothetical protein
MNAYTLFNNKRRTLFFTVCVSCNRSNYSTYAWIGQSNIGDATGIAYPYHKAGKATNPLTLPLQHLSTLVTNMRDTRYPRTNGETNDWNICQHLGLNNQH